MARLARVVAPGLMHPIPRRGVQGDGHTIFTSNVELGQGATGQAKLARALASSSGLASGSRGQHYMTDVKLVSELL